jgi:hypothetical protein
MSPRHAPKSNAPKPTLKQRAAIARDAAGRFIRRKDTVQTEAPAEATDDLPHLGTVPVSANAHPETYGLRLDANGLGRHAPPGASIIVEPTPPTGAGLAVLYLKDAATPLVFDLTHDFLPSFAGPIHPDSSAVPLIPMCEPASGALRALDASRLVKMHRITGIYTPMEAREGWTPAPPKLPLLTECPEGMGEHRTKNAIAYPLVRPGETVIYDPTRRDLMDGALCIIEWSTGRRDLLLTNLRQSGGKGELRWWVDPVNGPAGRADLDRRLANPIPGAMMYTSDGPYTEEHLRERIVGTVVGVLVPPRVLDGASGGQGGAVSRRSPIPAPLQASSATSAALADVGLTSEVSEELVIAIEDHAEAIAAGRLETDDNDEAFDRIAVWQTETDEALRAAPVRSLADLRAKLTYLTPIMSPDMLDATHVAHLKAICADIDKLCRERSRPSDADGEAELLQLGERLDRAHAEWRRAVWKEQEPGERFVAFMADAKAKPGGATPADHETAWALPGVREVALAEESAFERVVAITDQIWEVPHRSPAGLAVKARAAVCDAYGNGQYGNSKFDLDDEDMEFKTLRRLIEACCTLAGVDWRGDPIAPPVADPVFAVIERHLAARAACDGLDDVTDKEAFEAAHNERRNILDEVEATRPTTLAGLLALAQHMRAYLSQDAGTDKFTEASEEGMAFLGLLNACRDLPAQPNSSSQRDWVEAAEAHPGLVPFPQRKPAGLLALEYAIPREGAHLLAIAEAEFERRRQAYVGASDPTVWPWLAAQLRRDMRMDALAIVAMPARSERLSAADPIAAAILAHTAAREAFEASVNPHDAAWVRASGGDASREAMAAATASYTAACDAERMAWVALFETRPTTLAGVLALARHAQRYAPSNDGLDGAPDLEGVFAAIADGLEPLTGGGRPVAIASEPDPVFAAIAASRRADAAMAAFDGNPERFSDPTSEESTLSKAQMEAREAALGTVPTTPEGLRAFVEYVRFQASLLYGDDWQAKASKDMLGEVFLSLCAVAERTATRP